MFCKACGAQMPDGTLFCSSCGRPMNMPASKDFQGQQGSAQVSSGGAMPQQSSGMAQQTSGMPQQTSGMAQQTSGVAQQTSGMPQQIPVTPPQMPPVPQRVPPAVVPPMPASAPRPVVKAQKKSGTFKFVLVGMVALLFLAVLAVGVFGFTQGWFSNDGGEPQVNDSAPEQTTQPATEPTLRPSVGEEDLVAHQWEGVTIFLQKEHDPYHWDEDYMEYYSDQVDVRIDSFIPENMSDSIVSSRSFAEYYKACLADNYRQVGIYSRDEVYYIQGIYNDSNLYEVTAFYMAGEYAYTVMVTDQGTDQMDEMIRIATTAVIDESVVPAISTSDGVLEKTDTPSYQGLTLQLHQVLEEDGFYDGGVGYENDYIRLIIEQGSMENRWDNFTDSASLAQCNQELMEGLWQEASVDTFNGRSYVLCRDDDGYTCVVGCYVRDGQWWEVSAYFFDFEVYTADVIRDVTSGTFGEQIF